MNDTCELCGDAQVIHYNARYGKARYGREPKEITYPCPECIEIIHPGKILNYIWNIRHSLNEDESKLHHILVDIENKIKTSYFCFDLEEIHR